MRLIDVEHREHSQNGEDGIIKFLLGHVTTPDRRFVEIGSGAGKENNSTSLVRRGYSGVCVDRKAKRTERHRAMLESYGWSDRVEVITEGVYAENAAGLVARFGTPTPDFFSLDIDGVDWHVWRALAGAGFRPKVICCEYNPTFGPRRAVSVPAEYRRPYSLRNIYFGASLEMWRRTLEPGYKFVTVCSAGINAFFVDPAEVQTAGLRDVAWLAWADCPALEKMEGRLDERAAKIGGLELYEWTSSGRPA